jgi:cytochrome c oxidase subunit I
VAAFLFAIGLVSVFATPLIFLAYDVTSVEHHRLQTWLMRFGGGLAIAPVATAVIVGLVRWRRTHSALDARARPLRAALVASIVLFGVGGIIGFAIHGSNVTIPAHYHGCIVGVTLAMMGLAYWLLPRIGFAAPPARLATLQARLYGTGQLLHVVGLLWSGGYGVQRKVADGAVVERSLEQIASMGLMGLGGLIAIAGGMLFVAIVVIAVLRRPRVGAAVELA